MTEPQEPDWVAIFLISVGIILAFIFIALIAIWFLTI